MKTVDGGGYRAATGTSMRFGRWQTGYFCVECEGELSWDAMMNSPAGHGTCPICGFRDPGACTIVACKERPYRWVYGGFLNLFKQHRVFRDAPGTV